MKVVKRDAKAIRVYRKEVNYMVAIYGDHIIMPLKKDSYKTSHRNTPTLLPSTILPRQI